VTIDNDNLNCPFLRTVHISATEMNWTRHRASTSMYSLTFRVRRYAVMCTNCQYARCRVFIATKSVHRLQIRAVVHN